MAACSDYFLATICGAKNSPSVSVTNGPNGEHITIELKYVTVRGFTPLLEYAYSSDLHVNSSDVIDVLSAASYMQMFNVSIAQAIFATMQKPNCCIALVFVRLVHLECSFVQNTL